LARQDIKAIIWDLDNTLYQFTDAFKLHCNEAAARAVSKIKPDFSYEQALNIAVDSYQRYHFSLYRFVTEFGLTYEQLHFDFHEAFDESFIAPLDGIFDRITKIDLPQIILTNASRDWARRALKQVGGADYFKDSDLIALEDFSFEPKARSFRGYELALERLGSKAHETLLADDVDRNSYKAREFGIKTSYIHYDGAALDEALTDHNHETALTLCDDLF